jgi:hypothetical protein
MADERPIRSCDLCGGEDDHPRHVTALADGGTLMRHMDCCREAGCPDGSCDEVTQGAEKLRGDELVQHLTSRSEENHGT